MKVFYDPVQKTHVLTHEIIAGKKFRHHERPSRIDQIVRKLRSQPRFTFESPSPAPLEAIRAVHEEGYLALLRSSQDIGKEGVIWPYTFPNDPRLPLRAPATALTAGQYCFDVGTPIMRDTWQAALAAVSDAFSAAQHVRRGGLRAYALARPPGHHAANAMFGGYCYINNAAVAARYLSQYGEVLVVDFDFHHGNGTQSIFYDDPRVGFLSVHGHPEEEYPYFSGWENETGIDDGAGLNLNVPLRRDTSIEAYFSALSGALDAMLGRIQPKHLVLSAGFDIADRDPLGHFGFLPEHFARLGDLLASLKLPTVIVQEGGYLIAELGTNVEAFLLGFLERHEREFGK